MYQVGTDNNPPILDATFSIGIGKLQELSITLPREYYDALSQEPKVIYADGYGGTIEAVSKAATTVTLTAKGQAGFELEYARLNPVNSALTVREWLNNLVLTVHGTTQFTGDASLLSSTPNTSGLAIGAFFSTLTQLAGNYGLEVVHISTAHSDLFRFVNPGSQSSGDITPVLNLTVQGNKLEYDYVGVTKLATIGQKDTVTVSASSAIDNNIKYTSNSQPYLEGKWSAGHAWELSCWNFITKIYECRSYTNKLLNDQWGNPIQGSSDKTTGDGVTTSFEIEPRMYDIIHTVNIDGYATVNGERDNNFAPSKSVEILDIIQSQVRELYTEELNTVRDMYRPESPHAYAEYTYHLESRRFEEFMPSRTFTTSDFPWAFVAKEIVGVTETETVNTYNFDDREGWGWEKTTTRTPIISDLRFSANFDDTFHPPTIDPNPPADISLDKHSESFFDPAASPHLVDATYIQSDIANIQYHLGTRSQKISLAPDHRIGILTARWLDGTKIRYYTVENDFDLSAFSTGGPVRCMLISSADSSFTTLKGTETGEGYVMSGTVWDSKSTAVACLPYIERIANHSVQVTAIVPFMDIAQTINLVASTYSLNGKTVHITGASCNMTSMQTTLSGYVIE